MSVPIDILRYAGIWNAASTYQYGMFVQSSLVNNSYVLITASLTGGSDPSVALAPNWVAFPTNNAGVLSVGVSPPLLLSGTAQDPVIDYPILQGTYYNTSNLPLTSPDTDITFSTAEPGNLGINIQHVAGSEDFTVTTPGLYQLEFNASIFGNGATWTAATSKYISIDLTRDVSPPLTKSIISQYANNPPGLDYSQSICATYNLIPGDVLKCRIHITFTGVTSPEARADDSFDLNTWFSWRFIVTV